MDLNTHFQTTFTFLDFLELHALGILFTVFVSVVVSWLFAERD